MSALRHTRENTTSPRENELEENGIHLLIRNDPTTFSHCYRYMMDAICQLKPHIKSTMEKPMTTPM